MSGKITQDIVKFRALQLEEDGRFCDLDLEFGREHQAEKATLE